ncbi:MAG: sodium:calcium antiporter [Parcubacteria group bacterium]|nr:sodium:calcium antiporter [Parcubacteria group bacterium]MCR4342422.1 sodium:calcium antiporter [Patescibacteria group bacterium]
MLIYIIIFLCSFFLIARSGSMLVSSLTYLSRLMGLSEYAIAFILMSFATSIPEFFIGISSTVQGAPELSFGNIIGANIINVMVVIGAVAIFSKEIKIESKISRENFWLISLLAFLPILLVSDGIISRGDGLVLIFSFLIYVFRLLGEKEYFSKILNGVKFNHENVLKTFKHFWKFALGILLLMISSFFLVWSGKIIATNINLPLVFFGLIFISAGTALPELAFGIKASFMDHSSMTLGNALGSIAFTATFIIGTMALIRPIYFVPEFRFTIAVIFLFIGFVLFNFFAYSRSIISRREGFVLILAYVVFLATQYLV